MATNRRKPEEVGRNQVDLIPSEKYAGAWVLLASFKKDNPDATFDSVRSGLMELCSEVGNGYYSIEETKDTIEGYAFIDVGIMISDKVWALMSIDGIMHLEEGVSVFEKFISEIITELQKGIAEVLEGWSNNVK